MVKEIWKDILGYEGLYAVSNLGRIKSYWRNNTILKPQGNKYKSLTILCIDGQGFRKNYQVHYLVARAFIPNPENKKYVVHLNGDKRDNRVENLLWSDISSDIFHNRKKVRKVAQFKKTGELIKEFPSIASASQETGIPANSIYQNCKHINKTAYGYVWKYNDNKSDEDLG